MLRVGIQHHNLVINGISKRGEIISYFMELKIQLGLYLFSIVSNKLLQNISGLKQHTCIMLQVLRPVESGLAGTVFLLEHRGGVASPLFPGQRVCIPWLMAPHSRCSVSKSLFSTLWSHHLP